ncbi:MULTISPECIES: hypothetical protein [unclassified Wolbachia]|nr:MULTISPECIES: hypothetical protein [unclassified Wolbachia]
MNHDFVIMHDACRLFALDVLIDSLAQFMINGRHAEVVQGNRS